ncbi:MAG: arsenate reductase (glutaredoxin) [Pseudomonadota bacterium]
MSLTIWHNPRCSKSRETLGLIEAAGKTPRIIAYLKDPPSAAEALALAGRLGLPIREMLRKGETAFKEHNLANPALSDAEIAEVVAGHPILIERPIVESAKGSRICRPPERVREIL